MRAEQPSAAKESTQTYGHMHLEAVHKFRRSTHQEDVGDISPTSLSVTRGSEVKLLFSYSRVDREDMFIIG